MQAPILSGVRVEDGALATSYPVNLMPRAVDTGISQGQLVTPRGARTIGTGPGADRGGIAWNDQLYRVMGSSLVKVAADGTVTTIGDVGSDHLPCGFDYSFDKLGIRSAGKLFYYDGTTLAQVTDPDLGEVRDLLWVDGYWMTTDGTDLVVTDLNDPTSVQPLHYGSAEADPDPIVHILKRRDEVYVLGKATIQVFQNVGGNGFPFAPVRGATIPYGCVGNNAACLFSDTFAFVGGLRGDPPGVYVGGEGTASKISTREIDKLLAAEVRPELIVLEARLFDGERQLLVHMAEYTACLPFIVSAEAKEPAWCILQSGWFGPYRPRHAVWCYGRHIVGDAASGAIGELTTADSAHFGEEVAWQFDVGMLFNSGLGMLLNEVELFGQFPARPVFFSVTRDGVAWSPEIARRLSGQPGERAVWRTGLRVGVMLGMRFRGSGRAALARCEARAEPLAA